MFDFNTARRVVLGSVGALILSTAATALATAPARASIAPVAAAAPVAVVR